MIRITDAEKIRNLCAVAGRPQPADARRERLRQSGPPNAPLAPAYNPFAQAIDVDGDIIASAAIVARENFEERDCGMKQPIAAALAIGIALSGCAPRPIYTEQAAIQRPVQLDPRRQDDCMLIRREIARQQRAAELSGVMSTALVEAAVRLNVANVIAGLETRGAIAGCG